jgi:UDP-N-acetylglucosamine 2-epimerase
MLDTARFFAENVNAAPTLEHHGVAEGAFYLATVHRASNSDNRDRLASIIEAFAALDREVLWAVHPRTAKNLEALGLDEEVATAENIRTIPPVSYIETVSLLRSAAGLLTDSGGMQKEAYFFGVPCVTLREETEWVETVELGWNQLTGSDAKKIVAAVASMNRAGERPDVYGDGHAAGAIVASIEDTHRVV